MRSLGWSILRIGLGSYIGVGLLVFFRQSRYIYYPDRDVGLTPAYFKLPFEDLRLRTSDGEALAAWYVPAAPGTRLGTLLFCHGNAGNIGDRVPSILTFHEMGLDVLIFDYRGYGDSTGKPTEKGTYLDSESAWKHLVEERKIPPPEIVLFGRSLGGSVASRLATQVQPGALVIESAFTSAGDMAQRMFPYLPVRWFCRFKYDSVANLGAVKCPVLVAHGRDDELVPFAHGQRLFAAAPEPKVFVEMRGGHNDGGLDIDSDYQRSFRSFVVSHLKHLEP